MKVAVVGAGAAGLAAAYDLARAGHEVVIYEAGAEVGGLAAGFKAPHWEWTLEKFYHHWFSNDQDIIGFIQELGFGDRLRFSSPTTSYYDEAGNFALDKPVVRSGLISRVINVLSIPGLPLIDRLRFGIMGAYLAAIPDGTFLEKHTADAWLMRRVGRRAHERVWRPMLIGKFGPLYDQVNMAWMWARIYKRTASLGTYVGGFQAALEDIAGVLGRMGVSIRLSAPVQRIAPGGTGGVSLKLDEGVFHYDQALCTFGPALMARLAPDLPEPYLNQLRSLKGMGALSVVLTLDRQLMTDGTYWLNLPATSADNPLANPFPYLALVEHTNWQSPAHYGGDHIIYMGDYLPADHEHMHLDDEALLARFLPSLRRVNPAFSESWIRQRWVFRVPYAQPVPLVNQSQHIPAIRTPIKGLYLASMAQVYPWDRGTNYAVEIGRRAARMMLEDA
ncbi:MAG: NAD(P)/FAD-dependent oxidoreductase [Anaerolineae bacterium]